MYVNTDFCVIISIVFSRLWGGSWE